MEKRAVQGSGLAVASDSAYAVESPPRCLRLVELVLLRDRRAIILWLTGGMARVQCIALQYVATGNIVGQ